MKKSNDSYNLVKKFIVIIISSLAITALMFFIFCKIGHDDFSDWYIVMFFIILQIAYFAFACFIIYSFYIAFSQGTYRLKALFLSYLTLLLLFSCSYFTMQYYTEKIVINDILFQTKQGQQWSSNPKTSFIRDAENIWVDCGTTTEYGAGIRTKLESTNALLELIADSFHISTAAITTLGFSDIKPNTWYSKLLFDLECLMGLSIIFLSIGLYISRKQ